MLKSSHISPHTVQHLLDTLADEVAQALARERELLHSRCGHIPR